LKHLHSVTSRDSLFSTIQTDDQVNRWFEFLIIQTEVKKSLLNHEGNGISIRQFLKIKLFKNVTFLFLIGSLMSCYWLNDLRLLYFTFIFLIIFIMLSTKLSKYTSVLSLEFVGKNFNDQQLSQTTLYTLSEFYSDKYKIPSLVDIQTIGDEYLRVLVIGLIFGLMVIYPFFSFTQILCIFTAVFLSIKLLMNSDLFYRALR
jgi:hypothetical protein